MQIITNNPTIRNHITSCPIQFVDGAIDAVFEQVRQLIINDKISLLTHPLSSSLKPNETVYKSVILTTTPGKAIDLTSLEMIERAALVHEKFQKNQHTPEWPQSILDDFALIDLDLMQQALIRAQRPSQSHNNL